MSKHEIFKYFDELLKTNIYRFLQDSAIADLTISRGSLVKHIDYEKGIVKHLDSFYDDLRGVGVEALVTYNFEHEFSTELYKQANIAKNKIENSVFEINQLGNNAKEFLKTQAKDLQYYIERAKTIYPKHKFIENTLIDLLMWLVQKYSLQESFKKQSKTKVDQISFFDIKANTKLSLLVDIYDTAVDLEVLDDESVLEQTFLNVLTGNPIKTQEVINFKCNNQLTVLFIKCIQPLFNNLTFSQIHKSNSFINNKGKTLNQDDLYSGNTRLNRNKSPEIERITAELSKILNL